MNVLVIGGGGREHTIVWKLAQSPKVKKLYAIPGGPGMMGLAECVPMDVTNLEGLAQWAETHAIDLTVVGPEAPLVAGLVDVFEAHGLKAFGPKAKAAEIEGSKIFSKELMEKYHVPTAFFKVCDSLDEAKAYVREKGAPIVIKGDDGKRSAGSAGRNDGARASFWKCREPRCHRGIYGRGGMFPFVLYRWQDHCSYDSSPRP